MSLQFLFNSKNIFAMRFFDLNKINPAKCCVLFILILSVTNSYSQTASLIPLTPFPGDTRSEASSFAINGFGYVGAGMTSMTLLPSVDFWKYDPVSNAWTQIPNIPIPVFTAVGFSINGKGYVCGGYTGGGSTLSSALYEYDPIANSWAQKTSYPLLGLGAGTAVVLNGLAYVGNGVVNSAGNYTNDFYYYDPVSDLWSPKAQIPILGEYTFSFTANNKLYFGGGELPYNNRLYEYDPLLDTWSQKNNLPFVNVLYPFHYATGFSISNEGYVFGGRFYNTGIGNHIHKYDVMSDTWTLIYSGGNMQPPHYGNNVYTASIFVINNIPYITQGVSGGNDYFPGLYQIDIVSTNINEIGNDLEIKISNIENNICYLFVNDKLTEGEFYLYSVTGSLICHSTVKNGWNTIIINAIKPGVYYYRLSGNSGINLSGRIYGS